MSLQPICEVSLAQVSDVDKAVGAAKEAFEEGEWSKMNPRDRGRLIYRSALFLPPFLGAILVYVIPVCSQHNGCIITGKSFSFYLLNQSLLTRNVI